MHILDNVIRPWAPMPRANFWLLFSETKLQYESLKGLISLLVFLV